MLGCPALSKGVSASCAQATSRQLRTACVARELERKNKPMTKVAVIDKEKQVCDVCTGKLTAYKTFSDASLPAFGGSWGWVCGDCASRLGVRYGVGLGQEFDSETLMKVRG